MWYSLHRKPLAPPPTGGLNSRYSASMMAMVVANAPNTSKTTCTTTLYCSPSSRATYPRPYGRVHMRLKISTCSLCVLLQTNHITRRVRAPSWFLSWTMMSTSWMWEIVERLVRLVSIHPTLWSKARLRWLWTLKVPQRMEVEHRNKMINLWLSIWKRPHRLSLSLGTTNLQMNVNLNVSKRLVDTSIRLKQWWKMVCRRLLLSKWGRRRCRRKRIVTRKRTPSLDPTVSTQAGFPYAELLVIVRLNSRTSGESEGLSPVIQRPLMR